MPRVVSTYTSSDSLPLGGCLYSHAFHTKHLEEKHLEDLAESKDAFNNKPDQKAAHNYNEKDWADSIDSNFNRITAVANFVFYTFATASVLGAVFQHLAEKVEFKESKTLLSTLGTSLFTIDQLNDMTAVNEYSVKTKDTEADIDTNHARAAISISSIIAAIGKLFEYTSPVAGYVSPILYLASSVISLWQTYDNINLLKPKMTQNGLKENRLKKAAFIKRRIETAQLLSTSTVESIINRYIDRKDHCVDSELRQRYAAIIKNLEQYQALAQELEQSPASNSKATAKLKVKLKKLKNLLASENILEQAHIDKYTKKHTRLSNQATRLAGKENATALVQYLNEKQQYKMKRLQWTKAIATFSSIAASCFVLSSLTSAAFPPLGLTLGFVGIAFASLSKVVKVFRPNRSLGTRLNLFGFKFKTKVRQEYEQMMLVTRKQLLTESKAGDTLKAVSSKKLNNLNTAINTTKEEIHKLQLVQLNINTAIDKSEYKKLLSEHQAKLSGLYKQTTTVVENYLIKDKLKLKPADELTDFISNNDRKLILRTIINDRRAENDKEPVTSTSQRIARVFDKAIYHRSTPNKSFALV